MSQRNLRSLWLGYHEMNFMVHKKNRADVAEESYVFKTFPQTAAQISLGLMPGAQFPNYRLFGFTTIPASCLILLLHY